MATKSYASVQGAGGQPPTRSAPGEPQSWKTVLKGNYHYLIIVLTPILMSPIAIAQPNPVSFAEYS